MRSKKELLSKAKLYLILDRQVNTYPELFEITKKAMNAGVDIFQLRDKNGLASEMIEFSHRVMKLLSGRKIFIVNDRVDVALIAAVDGVHLGQEDVLVKDARRILGPGKIVGVSCQKMSHVLKAQKDGADYLGFGSIFKTLTKPQRQPQNQNLIRKVYKAARIPVFAIGGIDRKNVINLKSFGVNRIAVCRAICLARDVKKEVEAFARVIQW